MCEACRHSAPSMELLLQAADRTGRGQDEDAGSGVGAWQSPRGHGVTSVNSCQRALRQLYETRSELYVGHVATNAP